MINLAGKIQQQLQPRKASAEAYRASSGAGLRIMKPAEGKVLSPAPALLEQSARAAVRRMVAGTLPVHLGDKPRASLPSIAVATSNPTRVGPLGEAVEKLITEARSGDAAKGPRHARLVHKRKPSRTLGEVAAVQREKKRAALAKAPGKNGPRVAFVGGVHPVDIANGINTSNRGVFHIRNRRLPKGTPATLRDTPPEIVREGVQAPRPQVIAAASASSRPPMETDPVQPDPQDAGPAAAAGAGVERMALLVGVVFVAWLMFKGGGAA